VSIGSRIKELRLKRGLTQEELAQKIGVTKGAVANYENEVSSPKIELMYRLFDALDCDANYLHQDDMKKSIYRENATPEEFETLVKVYRNLDAYGQEGIHAALKRETERTSQAREAQKRIENMEYQAIQKTIPKRCLAYYGRIADAGKPYEFEDILCGTIEVPLTNENKNADYTIGISGNSMEPDYTGEDIVYVQKTACLDKDDIGIFQKNDCVYIKKVGEGKLLSINPAYGPISSKDMKVLGKVIGKIGEEYQMTAAPRGIDS